MRLETDTGPEGFPVPNGAPVGFVEHAYRRSIVAPFPVERVWGWLNDPATFTEGQVWPFRVEEFVDGGFEPGVLNAHHGPFLNAAGVIGEVRRPRPGVPGFRNLKYFYGSYALSPRLVRPTRLRFWVEESPAGGTLVTLRLDSLVRRRFERAWDYPRGSSGRGSRAGWGRPSPEGNSRSVVRRDTYQKRRPYILRAFRSFRRASCGPASRVRRVLRAGDGREIGRLDGRETFGTAPVGGARRVQEQQGDVCEIR